MKRINEHVLALVAMILIYLILTSIISATWWIRAYNTIINPICWIGMFLFCYFNLNCNGATRNEKITVRSVLFITILYIIFYFTTGLFIGYARNPLSMQSLLLLKNLWSFVVILFFQEYVRCSMVKSSKTNKLILIAISVLFAFIEINISTINNLSTSAETFKYISKIVLPAFARSFLFTYLATLGGFKATLAYRIPTVLITVILPILPDYDWFFTSISELLVVVVIYLYISYQQTLKDRRISRKQKEKSNPIASVPALILLLLMVAFVAGFLKYQPVAIVSNSMVPIYQRGDAVIIEHIDKQNLKSIENGTIIEYILDGKIITHRVIEITKNKEGKVIYITKGDNNNAPDINPVYENQIIGIVRWYIPKIGYPSVWFSELIK